MYKNKREDYFEKKNSQKIICIMSECILMAIFISSIFCQIRFEGKNKWSSRGDVISFIYTLECDYRRFYKNY